MPTVVFLTVLAATEKYPLGFPVRARAVCHPAGKIHPQQDPTRAARGRTAENQKKCLGTFFCSRQKPKKCK